MKYHLCCAAFINLGSENVTGHVLSLMLSGLHNCFCSILLQPGWICLSSPKENNLGITAGPQRKCLWSYPCFSSSTFVQLFWILAFQSFIWHFCLSSLIISSLLDLKSDDKNNPNFLLLQQVFNSKAIWRSREEISLFAELVGPSSQTQLSIFF